MTYYRPRRNGLNLLGIIFAIMCIVVGVMLLNTCSAQAAGFERTDENADVFGSIVFFAAAAIITIAAVASRIHERRKNVRYNRKKTQLQIIAQAVSNGALTINEARQMAKFVQEQK